MTRVRFLAILCLVGTLGCSPDSSPTPNAQAAAAAETYAVPVRVAPVEVGSLTRTLRLGGTAQASRRARLAPTGQGTITALPARLGMDVAKGDLLAELDTSTLRLRVEQARVGAKLAQLQLQDASSEVARARRLAEAQAIPTQTLDKAESAHRLAQAQRDQAEASLAVLQDQVGKARLTAPFAGTVTAVALELGEFFTGMAGLGGPPMLVEVQALDPITVDLHVPDVDLARLSVGMEARVITSALPDREWTGHVELINAAADRGSRTFLVRIVIPNPDRALRPGLFVESRLVLERLEGVMVVPNKAVTIGNEATFVMVVDGDRARRVSVVAGLRGDQGRQVEGLEPGSRVIVEGQFGLPDGNAIKVVE
jgi:RND family efflux transporter MFP subunit